MNLVAALPKAPPKAPLPPWIALLRMILFTHRELWAWLDQPFTGPPTVLIASQAVLDLGKSGQQNPGASSRSGPISSDTPANPMIHRGDPG